MKGLLDRVCLTGSSYFNSWREYYVNITGKGTIAAKMGHVRTQDGLAGASIDIHLSLPPQSTGPSVPVVPKPPWLELGGPTEQEATGVEPNEEEVKPTPRRICGKRLAARNIPFKDNNSVTFQLGSNSTA